MYHEGSPSRSLSRAEVWMVLKVSFWFGVVAAITKGIELTGTLDFGDYKALYQIIAPTALAAVTWLAARWWGDTQPTRQPLVRK